MVYCDTDREQNLKCKFLLLLQVRPVIDDVPPMNSLLSASTKRKVISIKTGASQALCVAGAATIIPARFMQLGWQVLAHNNSRLVSSE